MGVLADWQIEELAHKGMITPYHPGGKESGKISSGVTSYGYDVRLGYVGKIFSPINATVIDPKAFDPKALVTIDLTPRVTHQWRMTDDVRECVNCKSQNLYGNVEEFKKWSSEVCPKHPPDHFLIPPHSFMLGESIEEFDIPRHILVQVLGKSTYARCGLVVNVTPGEPEWVGKWTIELSNTTPIPIKVYAGEGIMQALFHVADRPCRTSYKDKKGRYQAQSGLTLPFVEGKDETK